MILPEHILIDPRLVVKAMAVSFRNDLHQIFISLIVLCQQYQVPHPLISFSVFIEQGTGSCIDLAADHRANALFFTFPVKIDDPEHNAVVCDSQRRHAQFLCTRHQISDPGSTVQQTVFCMYM